MKSLVLALFCAIVAGDALAQPATQDDLRAAYCLGVIRAEVAEMKALAVPGLTEMIGEHQEQERRIAGYLVARGYGTPARANAGGGTGIVIAGAQGRADHAKCSVNWRLPICPRVSWCRDQRGSPY